MLRINYKPSTSHWIFPPIIMWILGILLVCMLIKHIINSKKEGKPIANFKNFRIFVKDWDKVKTLGTLILCVLYIACLEPVGFLPSSIIFIFLFNVLFCGLEKFKSIPVAFKEKKFWSNPDFRSLLISLIIAVVSSVIIWLLFSKGFKITLP